MQASVHSQPVKEKPSTPPYLREVTEAAKGPRAHSYAWSPDDESSAATDDTPDFPSLDGDTVPITKQTSRLTEIK
jgi:hypothetical protein